MASRPAAPSALPAPISLSTLEDRFDQCGLIRPFRRTAYDPGDTLEYEAQAVHPHGRARVGLEIERFVGGGFAGQVYRVRVLSIEAIDGKAARIAGLEVGRHYAIKILTPPSGFARRFRNLLYWLGYQANFGAQVLPAAVRVGVLWQKVIRRAMQVECGDPDAVCDTYATFYDGELKSHGEINEWIDGRIWKFEADDRITERWKFGGQVPAAHPSAEYVYKKRFMAQLVDLLHRMGAGELARQYEWWTCKSTPNVLKRVSGEGSPAVGLTAVDFRAGLTLLPFLPMSPADFVLIIRGLLRGKIVQFDRCDMRRFRSYVEQTGGFDDLRPAIQELEEQTAIYRSSQPDITHNHLRLVFSSKLRRSIRSGIVTAWQSLGRLDGERAEELAERPFLLTFLSAASVVPGLGPIIVSLWGSSVSRRHTRKCWTSLDYLGRAMKGARIEALVDWLRDDRVDAATAEELVGRPIRFWAQRLSVGWLPPKWHRFFGDWQWGRALIREKLRFTLDFLRKPEFREQFLLDEVRSGRREGMLSEAETARIESQIKDPFIQKYLKCLAVHLCTVPITQIVMVAVGAGVTAYCLSVRGMSWPESLGLGTAAAAAIQLMPVSPGSIARGLFVLYLMLRERDIRNYYIAAPVSFLHVVGYLAFPLQMVTHNPSLARFLAGRWTKNTVHLVPVFGESGALLEHGIFDLFFNVPLSLSRAVRRRPRVWALGSLATLGLLFLAIAAVYLRLANGS